MQVQLTSQHGNQGKFQIAKIGSPLIMKLGQLLLYLLNFFEIFYWIYSFMKG